MGFIAKASKQGNTQLIGFAVEGVAFPWQEHLLTLFGQGADVELLVQIQLSKRLHHCRQLTFSPVDHHHVRPIVQAIGLQGTPSPLPQGSQVGALRFDPRPATKATAHDLGHCHEVIAVAGLDAAAANFVLAVVLFGGQAIDEHHL